MQFNIKNIKYILGGLPLLVLSSCVNEYFDGPEENAMKGEPLYLTIQIKTSEGSGTRAIPENSELVNGEEGSEHPTGDKIQGAHAIFFDAGGRFMAMADMNPMNYKNWNAVPSDKDLEDGLTGTPGHHGEPDYTGENGIEATYFTVLNASLNEAEQPKKVLVVLNDDAIKGQLDKYAVAGSTIEDFKGIVWQNLQDGTSQLSQNYAGSSFYFDEDTKKDTRYFTLSNAAYVDANGVEHYAYDIPRDAFKKTQKEAKESQGVIVHVERMVSKFTPIFQGYTSDNLTYRPYDGNQVTIAEFDSEGNPIYHSENWNMTITGWAMNGLETQNYLFKKITNTPYYGWTVNGNNGWNDTKEYRSYWGEDPHYKTGEGIYPFQYRPAVEKNHLKDGFKYYGDQRRHGYFESRNENQTYDWALKYFSYNDLNENGIRQDAYAPENTYEESIATTSDLDNRNNKIAGTHMLFCADLHVSTDGMSDYQDVGEHFYRDRIGICYYTEADLFWGFVRAVNRKLESQGYMQYMRYTWDENDPNPITPESRYFYGSGKMKLYHGNNEITYEYVQQLFDSKTPLTIPAKVLHGDGKVLPWLSDNQLNIRNENGSVVTVTYHRGDFNEDLMNYEYEEVEGGFGTDDLMSLFYEWCGAVDHYHWGKMYYAAPILHSSKDENGSQDIYGIVRNHWYKIRLLTVLNLGTPIDDLDQRIIPDNVYTKDNIKVDVEILPWHILDFSVDLPN